MANNVDVIFEGARRKYKLSFTGGDGVYYEYTYYLKENLRLRMTEQAGSIIVTAGAKIVENWYANSPSGYVDGQFVWRRSGEQNWTVLDSFSAQSGNAIFAFRSGTTDSDGYVNLYANDSVWQGTITGSNITNIEIGYRPLPNSPAGYLKFGNTFVTNSANLNYYAFNDSSDPVYQSATIQTSGSIWIDTGSEWIQAIPYVDTGSEWVQAIPYVDTGSEWVQCG